LVQSNEWVANITFSDGYMPQPGDLYWRAIIMGAFDGTRWQAFDGTYIDSAEVPAAPRSVHYQMIVRDQQGVLPALDYPTDVPPGSDRPPGAGGARRAQPRRFAPHRIGRRFERHLAASA
jgi:hypothetical protein